MFYPPMPPPKGMRMTIGMDNAPRVRLRSWQRATLFVRTPGRRRHRTAISTTVDIPPIAMPTAKPTMPDSASGGVEAAVLAEVAGQPVGHPEHSAKRSTSSPNTPPRCHRRTSRRAVRHWKSLGIVVNRPFKFTSACNRQLGFQLGPLLAQLRGRLGKHVGEQFERISGAHWHLPPRAGAAAAASASSVSDSNAASSRRLLARRYFSSRTTGSRSTQRSTSAWSR